MKPSVFVCELFVVLGLVVGANPRRGAVDDDTRSLDGLDRFVARLHTEILKAPGSTVIHAEFCPALYQVL